MQNESSNPTIQTIKKEKSGNYPFMEGIKTKSGRKKKEVLSQSFDKRSNSMSNSLFVPKTLDFKPSPCSQHPLEKTKDSVIHRWIRNDDIFKGKYHQVHEQSIPHPGPKRLFLGRSNSDVCTVYESDSNFNTRMEAEKDQGENKYIHTRKPSFKEPMPIPIRHKDIIAQLNNEERKGSKNALPHIYEDDNESVAFSNKLFSKKGTITTEQIDVDDDDCMVDESNPGYNRDFSFEDSMEIETDNNEAFDMNGKFVLSNTKK